MTTSVDSFKRGLDPLCDLLEPDAHLKSMHITVCCDLDLEKIGL